MSFDIFYTPIRLTGESSKVKDPFTGKTISLPARELTPNELRTVQSVLKRACPKGPMTVDITEFNSEMAGAPRFMVKTCKLAA